MFGSGTQGLHNRTLSPPPRVLKSVYPPSTLVTVGYRWARTRGVPGGWTMYWYGMVIRCGEQLLQTTLPHFLAK